MKEIFVSHSLKDTTRIAKEVARELTRSTKHPLVVALKGDLGASKTTFTKAFLRGLGVRATVISPTFVLMKEYTLTKRNYKRAYHIDVYRLRRPVEIFPLFLTDLLKERSSIIIIEWADKIKKRLPAHAIWITFKHGKKENERIIELVI